MKPFKFFSFWLTLCAVAICLFNLSGHDDKNLLLFLTSPILWFLEDYSSFLMRFISQQELIWIYYFLNVFFWSSIGWLIDSYIHRKIRKKILTYLARIGIGCLLIIGISVVFYNTQNSEKAISNIIKNPDQYNEQSVRIAVVRSAKEGYGDQYIEEMVSIIQTTKSRNVFASTIYALGLIGTPNSIKALIESVTDPKDIRHVLPRNEQTIITMLEIDQSTPMINAGIEAAQILKFTTFVQPLNLIMKLHANSETQDKAAKVIQLINQNPQQNNPKWQID